MPTTLKNPIQRLTQEHFTKPQTHTVLGIDIKVIPMPKDIPILENQSFDELHDVLRVTFKNSGHINQKQIDAHLTFLTDAKTGFFAGFIVTGVKEYNIQQIRLIIEKKINDLKVILREKLESENREKILETIGKFDQNERRLDFLKELIKQIETEQNQTPIA